MGRHKSTTYDADTTFSTTFSRKHSAELGPLDWGAYIIRPTDQKYEGINHIPNACGVYAWYSREEDLLYIGRSVSMRSRLRSHHMPIFGGVLLSYRLVPRHLLPGVEMAHIETLEPPENASREVEHLPFWKEFCGAVDATWRDVLPAMKDRVRARQSALAARIAARL